MHAVYAATWAMQIRLSSTLSIVRVLSLHNEVNHFAGQDEH